MPNRRRGSIEISPFVQTAPQPTTSYNGAALDPLDAILSRSDILDGQLIMEEKALQIVADEISTKKESRLLEARLAEAKKGPLLDAADAVIRAASELPDECASARALETERAQLDAEVVWTQRSTEAWAGRAQTCRDTAEVSAAEASASMERTAASDAEAAAVRTELAAQLSKLHETRAEAQRVASATRAAAIESESATLELKMALEDKAELAATLTAQRAELARITAAAVEEERLLESANARFAGLAARSAALGASEREQSLATVGLRTTNLESEVLVKRLQAHTASLRDQTRSLSDYALAEDSTKALLASEAAATRAATVDPAALQSATEAVGAVEQDTLVARTQRYQAIREAEGQALRALVGRSLIEQDEQWNARAREMINQTNEEIARVETDISTERQRRSECDATIEQVRGNLAVIDLAVAERLKELEWLRPALINAVTTQQNRPSPTSPQKFDQTKLAVQLASRLVMEKTRTAGGAGGAAMGLAGTVRPTLNFGGSPYAAAQSPAAPAAQVRVNRKGSIFIQ